MAGWFIAAVAAVALVFAVVLSAIFLRAARAALPQVDGEISVPGLAAAVAAIRDVRGVPHIRAASAADLFFAQGYITAQDRLWQMDMSRRYSAGELSEVLGGAFLATDKEQRILRLRLVAEKAATRLDALDRAHIESYAQGVNAYITQHRNALPLEFRVLRYSPQPWTPADSLLCGILMSEMLNGAEWQVKLSREAVQGRLPPELLADLYPSTSWRDHAPGEGQTSIEDQVGLWHQAGEGDLDWHERRTAGSAQVESKRPRAGWPPSYGGLPTSPGPDEEPAIGSNNWVVAGALSSSGKPLLSNDMHLVHRIPNTWYEAQLTIAAAPGAEPEFDVAGFTLPGLPCVIVGHNRRIAWGFTNIMPDVQDVYIETLNDKGQYLTPSGWEPLETRREIIHVKGRPDVALETEATRHGPLITQLVAGEKRALALRWTLYEQPPSVPFFDVDAAQNWDEFRRAFSQFTGPGQNVIYGDVEGHIGYIATGRVPMRAMDTVAPVKGADGAHEWRGYIPFEAMPRVFDPPSGIIATANSRISPIGYPYTVSTSWDAPPYRTQRIYYLLRHWPRRDSPAGHNLTVRDMLAIQTDIYSTYDAFFAQRFTYAVDHEPKASRAARAAADVLRRWDGRVTPDSSAPAIVALARRQLWRLLLEPKLGASPVAQGVRSRQDGSPNALDLTGWTAYRWPYAAVALENLVERQPPRWLPPQYQSYSELLAAALDRAVGSTGNVTGRSWSWGERSPLVLQHPIFGAVPFLRRWSGPGTVPQSGDAYTIKAAGPDFGPSERMTIDFSNLDASTMNIVTGESGNLFSANYMDQWNAWYGGTTFVFPFSREAVQGARAHELVLQPGR
ncbi:MAG: penicillin acylase family protein [Acidobacteria bacterium]|nr:penicillin acylase family protein [Acidobacteriota bacterium]